MEKTNTMKFLIAPSQRLINYNIENDNLEILNIRAQDKVINKQHNKLAIIILKSVKIYNISQPLTSQSTPILQSFFPKKVQGLSFTSENKAIVSDKFGDIYLATPQNPFYLNSNLGIPSFLKFIHNNKTQKEYVMLGDDYCKLKIYNYKNMHQITGIWYIANCIPLDILQISEQQLILLVKHQDKQNLKHTYKLYQFNIDNLEDGDFNGKLIFSDKSQPLNNSQYHPCTISYNSLSQRLYFLKLYENQLQIVSLLSSTKNQQQFSQIQKTYKYTFPQPIKDANSIDAQYIISEDQKKSFILITYGKYFNLDQIQTQKNMNHNVQGKWIPGRDGRSMRKINQNQYVLKWVLN